MHGNRTKFCVLCGQPFEARTPAHRYCDEHSRSIRYRSKKGIAPGVRERHCRQCGTVFLPSSNNQQHCSDACSARSARESRSNFYSRSPEKMLEYRNNWRAKVGTDSNMLRFRLRFPDAPTACQSCGEDRVLDIAHKPGHERNGRWRSKDNTTWPDKVWILCPTCHALIDRKGYDPSTLGLS